MVSAEEERFSVRISISVGGLSVIDSTHNWPVTAHCVSLGIVSHIRAFEGLCVIISLEVPFRPLINIAASTCITLT
jgi:hypothetical protein